MLSITSFTFASGDSSLSCWFFDFFPKLYFISYFSDKVFILTDKLSPDLICWYAWNDKVHVGNILQLLLLS